MRPIMPRVIDHRLTRFDALVLAGVEDHGVEERAVGAADDMRRDGRQRRIVHGVEQQLIALQPLFEDERRVLPLAELARSLP